MGPLGLLQISLERLLGPPGYVSGLPVDRYCRPSVFLVLTPESSSATVRLQPINFYEVKRGDRKSCLYGRVIPAVLTLGFCWAPLGASWAAYGSLLYRLPGASIGLSLGSTIFGGLSEQSLSPKCVLGPIYICITPRSVDFPLVPKPQFAQCKTQSPNSCDQSGGTLENPPGFPERH